MTQSTGKKFLPVDCVCFYEVSTWYSVSLRMIRIPDGYSLSKKVVSGIPIPLIQE